MATKYCKIFIFLLIFTFAVGCEESKRLQIENEQLKIKSKKMELENNQLKEELLKYKEIVAHSEHKIAELQAIIEKQKEAIKFWEEQSK